MNLLVRLRYDGHRAREAGDIENARHSRDTMLDAVRSVRWVRTGTTCDAARS